MDLIQKEYKHGIRIAYSNVEDELLHMKPGDRVLPAEAFYTPGNNFRLKAIFLPGSPGYPEGGYEVYEDAAVRCFYPDEVIIHPLVIKHQPTLIMIDKGIQEKINYDEDGNIIPNPIPKQRGRKSLSDDERAIKVAKSLLPKGKRGRPSLGKTKVAYAPTGGQRGRKKLTDEERAQRDKAKIYVPTGGKRGRQPLSAEEKAKREAEKAAKHAKSGGKRGRPSKS